MTLIDFISKYPVTTGALMLLVIGLLSLCNATYASVYSGKTLDYKTREWMWGITIAIFVGAFVLLVGIGIGSNPPPKQ